MLGLSAAFLTQDGTLWRTLPCPIPPGLRHRLQGVRLAEAAAAAARVSGAGTIRDFGTGPGGRVFTGVQGGIPPAQVAEWAGHSAAVLLKIYAKCLDGQDAIAKHRIEDALGDPGEDEETHPDDCAGQR